MLHFLLEGVEREVSLDALRGRELAREPLEEVRVLLRATES